MPAQDNTIPMPSAPASGYIRKVEIEGDLQHALFDGDGTIIYYSENRSRVFFFAAERGFVVRPLN